MAELRPVQRLALDEVREHADDEEHDREHRQRAGGDQPSPRRNGIWLGRARHTLRRGTSLLPHSWTAQRRPHLMMSADGWEEIAGAIERWITNVPEGAAGLDDRSLGLRPGPVPTKGLSLVRAATRDRPPRCEA